VEFFLPSESVANGKVRQGTKKCCKRIGGFASGVVQGTMQPRKRLANSMLLRNRAYDRPASQPCKEAT